MLYRILIEIRRVDTEGSLGLECCKADKNDLPIILGYKIPLSPNKIASWIKHKEKSHSDLQDGEIIKTGDKEYIVDGKCIKVDEMRVICGAPKGSSNYLEGDDLSKNAFLASNNLKMVFGHDAEIKENFLESSGLEDIITKIKNNVFESFQIL